MKAFAWTVTILYIAVATYIWVCPVKGYCPDGFSGGWFSNSKAEGEAFSHPGGVELMDINGSLEFPWGSAEPRYDSTFQVGLSSLSDRIKGADDQLFSISGLFHPDELKAADTINLGLLRANAIRVLLDSAGAPVSRVAAFFERLPDSAAQYGKSIQNGIVVRKIEADNAWLQKQDKLNVFRFDRNSSKLVLNEFQKSLLEQVLLYLRQNSEKHITLTGHTSSQGPTSENIQLGLERADALKSYLVQFGANADQITVESKGESELMRKPEQTEADRKTNRRVVLSL